MPTRRALLTLLAACLLSGCAAKGPSPEPTFDAAGSPPVSADTHFAAGQFAQSQGNLDQALAQYRAAVKVNPHHAPSLYQLGLLCTQLKRYPDAIAAWKQYILATNDSAAGYSNLGFTFQLAGESAAAENSYRAALSRDPNNRAARVNYGVLLAQQGKTEEATTQWASVLSPAEVHYNLASAAQKRGDVAAAREEYRKALALDPAMAVARQRLAEMGTD